MTARQLHEAADLFQADIHAQSSRPAVKAKLNTVERALQYFELLPLPPSVQKIHAIGTVLKAGKYKSAEGYLREYKGLCERSGHGFDGPLNRALKDAIRSCQRGLGGPVRALPLPFEKLRDLPGDDGPWSAGGPLFPRNLVVVGSWFMMRELEISTLKCGMVQIVESEVLGEPRVSCSLPASKTDQKALGVTRTHGCLCTVRPDPLCPAHAAWDQARRLRLLLKLNVMDSLPSDLPFFPNAELRETTKEAVASTLEAAAEKLAVPKATPDGSERISGHTLRVTGAQGMARCGIDVWAIQLLGRWGSAAVMKYVREAQLEAAASWASKAAASLSLGAKVTQAAASSEGQLALADGVCHEGKVDVTDALAHELRASSQDEEMAKEVVVSSTGVWHAVLLNPEVADKSMATSFCGWRFGESVSKVLKYSELPRNHKDLCARCFPSKREARKRELGAAARKLG